MYLISHRGNINGIEKNNENNPDYINQAISSGYDVEVDVRYESGQFFLGHDFISVNKNDQIKWDEIKHIVISLINDFYLDGKEYVIDENEDEKNNNLSEIEEKIVKILDQKIRPAVARDGGDIKFKEFKNGIVKVQLQGSCSGCPSSTMTLKQGVQNLLCHYLPEVKEVVAI